MTAKDIKNKGGASGPQRALRTRKQRTTSRSKPQLSGGSGPKRSFPKGVSRGLRQMLKVQASVAALADFHKKKSALEEERFGRFPDRVVPKISFKEKPFGDEVAHDQELCRSSVVSLALFDGDCTEENKLFACSGIALPRGKSILRLARFVTSACLVREFNDKRNRDDKLRVKVRLPDNTTTYGLLGLYDKDIAIVTSIKSLNVCPVHLDLKASPDCPDGHVLAAGRAFNSGSFMAMHGSLSNEPTNIFLSDSEDLTEAALGGPLVGKDNRFHGMIVDLCHDGFENRKCAKFLSLKSLYERLELFQILNPKEIRQRDFSLPEGVSSVVPSGFLKTSYHLRSLCYPMPPPLVHEFNGRLHDHFEESFGELLAWKGYPFGDPPNDYFERVWKNLRKEVVTNISRRVVSLASFHSDYSRSFACTGLLIKWHGSRTTRTVVLTSANLVRSCANESEIDGNLRIEVFLPPKQRCDGTLEFYDLRYNIAIVSVKKGFNAIRPEDIFNETKVSAKKVVAIGRDHRYGLLMAIMGEVKSSNKGNKGVLNCKELRCSTCKIKKAGIGGPLIDFDGSFVGMNFYDGSDVTPFLPRREVVNALNGANSFGLPSESSRNPMRLDFTGGKKKNRWSVPKAYWYLAELEEDFNEVHVYRGRTLL